MIRTRISRRIIRSSLILLTSLLTPFAWAQTTPAPTPSDTEDLPRRVAIRFLTDSDFPPFDYYDEDGVLTGFNVDIARAICLELAASCDIQARAWDDLIPALRRGEGDALIASHAMTPQTLAEFDFTDRYYHTPAWFAGRRGGPRVLPTPEGLAGQKVGVVRGSAHEAYLKMFFKETAVVAFETPELAREALATAKIDLIFDDGISLVFWVNGTLSRQCCEFKGGPFLEPKYFGDGIGIMVPKRDVQLKGLINQALRRVRESGRYEELMLRYFPNRLY
jgi:polar amino acid transport system substrate-binding protein